MKDLLNGTELMDRLGISQSTYDRARRRGQLKMFEVRRPFGQRKYSRKLLEDYLNGESPTRLGRRV